MRIMRAIFIGILLWLLIFIEWLILNFIPGLKALGGGQWIIHFVLLIPITIFGAGFYYKKRYDMDGFILGFIFLATWIALDFLITLPLFTWDFDYFLDYYRCIGFVEIVLLTGLYGLIENK